MFTFLPPGYRQGVAREYRARLARISLGLGLIAVLIGAILAIPSYAILGSQKDALALEKSALRASTEEDKAFAAETAALKEKIRAIDSAGDQTRITTVLDRVLSRRSYGVALNSIVLARDSDRSIVLSGVALTRDNLVAFSKSLSGEPSFLKVDLPIGSLAKNKDVPFTIVIESKF